jgi:transcriptional regulator with XRE-family HTH domain
LDVTIATGPLMLGERIAWYRRRRGMSQEVLAGLVGRTADWLSRLENNKIALDRLSVLGLIADALGISLTRLIDGVASNASTAGPLSLSNESLDGLRTTLADYSHLATAATDREPMDLEILKAMTGDAWSAYQDSRYTRATRLLPGAITEARSAVRVLQGPEQQQAYGLLAMAYQGAAMVLTKIGETDLAWLAADRGLAAANHAGDRLVIGSLYRSVAHCLLATGRLGAAAGVVDDAASLLAQLATAADPSRQSVYGTLFLVGAMAAAREGARSDAAVYLSRAEAAARRLGHDGNHLWTAFGPTTVKMHHVSTALELGDVETALSLGTRLDTSSLPIERRVRHKLDLARAHHARGHRDQAVGLLLDAEELAPEQVRCHYITRELVTAWVRTARDTPGSPLTNLAERLRIV